MNRLARCIVTGIAAIPLLLPTVGIGESAAAATKTTVTLQSQTVKLNSTSVLSVVDAYLLMQDKGNVLAFRIKIDNKGSNELSLIDYWMRVKSKTGKTFKINISEEDKNKKTIPANSSSYLTYYAVVDNSTKINDVIFDVVKWDFSVAGYERKLGTVKMPTNVTGKIEPYKGADMIFSNSKLKGALKGQYMSEDETYSYYTYNFLFENTGYQVASLNKLKLFVQTDDLIVYETTSSVAELTIQPRERQIITLQAKLPKAVAKSGKSLVVAMNDEANKVNIPIGSFALPTVKPSESTTYENTDYKAKLESIQRMPSQEDDILAADVVLTNPSSTAKEIPNLTGYFVINGIKYDKISTVTKLDQSATLVPGGAYNLVVHTRIPYSTTINSIQFVLTDIQDSKPGKALFNFAGKINDNIAVYPNDRKYEITSPGRRALARLTNAGVFEGKEDTRYYAEIEVTNDETRVSSLPTIGGYLKDNAGIIVPLSFNKNEKKISPKGTILLRGQGEIPDGFDLENYKFYMGQTVDVTPPQPESDSKITENLVVKPIAYQFSPNLVKNNTMDKIAIGNYELSFSQMRADIRIRDTFVYEGINLELKYALKETTKYENVPGDQKIYLELVEQGPNKVAYGKELSLKPTQSNTQALAEGNGAYMTLTFDDAEMSKKVQQFNTYLINVYALIGDAKVLVASKEYKWFYLNQ